MARIILYKTNLYLVLADWVMLWPDRSGPETNWCARIIQSTSGQHFRADMDCMQIGSGKFTGQKWEGWLCFILWCCFIVPSQASSLWWSPIPGRWQWMACWRSCMRFTQTLPWRTLSTLSICPSGKGPLRCRMWAMFETNRLSIQAEFCCAHLCHRVFLKWRVWYTCHWGASFLRM